MLQITIPGGEFWDEDKEEFVQFKDRTLQLEHSLVSISKWESKWHRPFLSKKSMTAEETIDYVRCMTLTQNVTPDVYTRLTNSNIADINHYIEDPMTATTISEGPDQKKNREVVTAELIYYWMIALNIPFECQKWHLNRLLCLIRVCNIKNSPPKKMSHKEIAKRNAKLNAARRKAWNTKG